MTTIKAKEIAESWLSAFTSAVESADVDALVSIILPIGSLRDLLLFTWDVRTLHGVDDIKEYLSNGLAKAQITDIKLDESQYLSPTLMPLLGGPAVCVEVAFTFEAFYGHGRGYARLLDEGSGVWKAFTLFTSLSDLRGYEEATGPDPSVDPEKPWLSWQELQDRKRATIERDPYVVIVGGGQSGLMIAARLKRMNIPAIVVERTARIGDIWRKRYPTLALHTIREHHTFLYQPYPSGWPTYTPRDKLADWMEQYAHSQDLLVWTSSEVLPHPTYNLEKRRWNVAVDRNGTRVTLNPAHIVIATGTSGAPRMPQVINANTFTGEIIHAIDFRGGNPYRGHKVVVIGAGNSAMDICEDLVYRGAESVTMVQRSSTCVVSRHNVAAGLRSFWPSGLPAEIGDLKFASIGLGVLRKQGQDHQQEMWDEEKELHTKLRNGGIKLNMGPDNAGQFNAVFERAGGYWIDRDNAADLIASGRIQVKNGVTPERYTPSSIIFSDGSELPADTVFYATGYENMRESIKRIFGPEVMEKVGEIHGLDKEGEIKSSYRPSGYPGLWFATSDFAIVRMMSKQLALQIKATELGLIPTLTD